MLNDTKTFHEQLLANFSKDKYANLSSRERNHAKAMDRRKEHFNQIRKQIALVCVKRFKTKGRVKVIEIWELSIKAKIDCSYNMCRQVFNQEFAKLIDAGKARRPQTWYCEII